MVTAGKNAANRIENDGYNMRIFVVAAVSLGLAGCSSMSSMDMFKSKPLQVTLQLDSEPAGADAMTSIGQGCKTPCSVSVAPTADFTVTYTLPNYDTEIVAVSVVNQSGEPLLDPNPAVAELKPAAPVKKPKAKKRSSHAAAPKAAPKTAAPKPTAPAAAQNSSPFPPPPR